MANSGHHSTPPGSLIPARVTHGRHCTCSACAREDWPRITGPCGMHGAGCPAVYAPIAPAGTPLHKPCPKCDDDGYTETWNDDQSDVVISVCSCQVLAQGIENAWLESEPVDE